MDRFAQAGQSFATLCRTLAQLRAPGGCAWDAKQTHQSLKPYLIEEAYEVLDAIESGNSAAQCDELGDLLLQVVFHAEIAQERGDNGFTAAEVSQAIHDKLVRRHPQIFSDNPEERKMTWEQVKALERPKTSSCLDGIPRAMPALLKAMRTGEKAAGVGFDWETLSGVMNKVDEEWAELQEVLPPSNSTHTNQQLNSQPHDSTKKRQQEEVGDLLFTLVNLCRHLEISADDALHDATAKFSRRFRWLENSLISDKKEISAQDADTLEHLWNDAKKATAKTETYGN